MKFEDEMFIIEPHPTDERLVLTADYNGQIVLWDIADGVILNVFQERGFHIDHPNTEMPILDAKWD